jgi:glutaminyl-tRNA synthetase
MSSSTPATPKHPKAATAAHDAASISGKPSNFLRQIIESDLEKGTYASRKWAGTPGDAAHHATGQPDPAKIRTRFPPEPNGYLHIGHAKSICINFGLARDYGGVCHLRFDDTNPEKETQEFVDGIVDTVKWLGFDWNGAKDHSVNTRPYQASDYFGFMYRAAEYLIEADLAYVDEQTVEQMRINRGDFGHPGVNSPFRTRTPAENLARFREMRDGLHEDGSMVLRAKIDMASPNINLRDPAIYRIRRATHHNTGDTWCIYPMYAYAHPIEDALENITHSICTLEFEDQLPDGRTVGSVPGGMQGGLLSAPPPRQYEFARLNLTYVITSKRKLAQLVYDHKVSGWDDPRMPTIVGLRRRGYTPESLQLFAERIGVTKSDSWIDYATLEGCLRESLDVSAPRAMAVLDPIKLVITNWDEVMEETGHSPVNGEYLDDCSAPIHPHHPELGKRNFKMGKKVWIERSDFEETPPKGFFRLFPGNKVRLKYGHVIECTGAIKDEAGYVTGVRATLVKDTKSGTPGSDAVKVKGVITWVSVTDGIPAEIRLYDRLFTEAQPDAGGKDFIESLNPNSLKVMQAFVEPSLAAAKADDKFQFERHGYFVADRVDHFPEKPVFNLAVGLKDSWGK